ncbi:MAG: hypothetical protein K2H72_02950 [Muribaculaceae bacterium]|nr:hypothetical protein [Muribaculaceae bacterium]
MTYIIPSIIAAVIVFFFARRLNKFENEETVLAMDTPDTQNAPRQTECHDKVEPSTEPDSAEVAQKSKDEQEKTKEEESSKEEPNYTAKTIDMIVGILKELGCQPTLEDENTIEVKYQGENFHFIVNGILVNIYDLPWTHFNIKDPNAQKMREAINYANFSTLPMVLMMAPDENGDVNVLSRYQTILHESCSVNKDYVTYILNNFFLAQREVRQNCNELIAKQEQPSKSRRPVGFDTGTE